MQLGAFRRSLCDEHFQQAVQLVDECAVLLLDPSGVVRTWNLGAERITGWRAPEMVGQHFSRLYTEEDVGHSKPELALRAAAEQGTLQGEGWRRRRDGGAFWAHVLLTALYDEQQHLVGFAKIARDLEERRAGGPLASVLTLTREAKILTDVRGIGLLASAAAERLLGVPRGFFTRRPLINVVARQDTRAFRGWLQELRRAPVGATYTRALRMRSRAGHVFVSDVQVTRLDAQRGAALHWMLAAPVQATDESVPSST